MKLLITGAEGQLGRSLQEALKFRNFQVETLTHQELDITDLNAIKKVVSEWLMKYAPKFKASAPF